MPLKLSPYMVEYRDAVVVDAMEAKPLRPNTSSFECVVTVFYDGSSIKTHRAWFVTYEEAERYYLAERRRMRMLPSEIWWNGCKEWESSVGGGVIQC